VKLAVAVAGCSRNRPHGLHVHRGESVSQTLVDPRQLASDAFRSTDSAESPGSPEVCERPDSVRLISYVSMPAAWCRSRVGLLRAAAPVVCCILCVASVPCCALVGEYNASHMLLLVRCPMLAAHEMRQCRVFPVASRKCSRPLEYRLLSVARCLLHALPGFAVFCAVSAACRMLPCCLVAVMPCCRVALLPCCLLSMVVSKIPCCLLHARCMLHAACCVACRCCPLHDA
jgi:hypothetical protein